MSNSKTVDSKLKRILQSRLRSASDRAPKSLGLSEAPLGATQLQIWRAGQRFPNSVAQNVQYNLRLLGTVNIDTLQRALDRLAERHEALRTRFVDTGAGVLQQVMPQDKREFEYTDLANEPANTQLTLIDGLQKSLAFAHLNPTTGELARFHLVRCSADDHLLLITLHHLVTDGWTKTVLVHDLIASYDYEDGGRQQLPTPLGIQPIDAYEWQREKQAATERAATTEHWVRYLQGTRGNLQLPIGQNSQPTQLIESESLTHGTGRMYRMDLPPELTDGIKQFCANEQITPYVFFVSVVCATLFHYGNREEVLIGCPIARRDHESLEDLVGCFMKTSILRFELSPQLSIGALLRMIKGDVLMALDHQNYDLAEVLEKLNFNAQPGRSPLFQAIVQYKNFASRPTTARSFNVEEAHSRHFSAPVDVAFEWELRNGHYGCDIVFDTQRLDHSLVSRIAGDLETVIRKVVDHLGVIDSLRLQACSPANVEMHLNAYKALNSPYQPFEENSVIDLIHAQVRRAPEHPALQSSDNISLTYAELWTKIEQQADRLRDQGVNTGDIVTINLTNRVNAIIALLSALRAGAAYFVVNDTLSDQQHDEIVRTVSPALLITDTGFTTPEQAAQPSSTEDRENTGFSSQTKDSTAYVMTTSGSTGAPKAVPITTAALANIVQATQAAMPMAAGDKVLQFSPLFSDFSVEQIFATLHAGATLVVPPRQLLDPEDFVKQVEHAGITQLHLPTSYFRALVENGVAASLKPSLKAVRVGGEVLQASTLNQWWQQTDGQIRLFNCYGPTEATVQSLSCEITPADKSIPLGQSLRNYHHYVVDPEGDLCPIGVAGELYIAGVGVSPGYLNHDNANSYFIAKDISGIPDEEVKLYRTGDRCYVDDSGVVHFLSRYDRVLKIRGYTVDLEVVAELLTGHSSVRGAFIDHDVETNSLVAWFVPQPEQHTTSAELRRFLAERVANYALPARFEQIEAWPLSAGGKIDRTALWQGLPDQIAAGSPPVGETEKLMADLWCSVLGLDSVSNDIGFLELGGNSIQAAQVLNRLATKKPNNFTVATLFEPLSLAELCLLLEMSLDAQP